MSPLDPAVFDAAADYLVREGLVKHTFCDGKRRCALGAVAEGMVQVKGLGIEAWIPDGWGDWDLTPGLEDEFERYAEYLADAVNAPYVPEWNDTPSRRRADVVKGLRKAANKLREEQSIV